MTATTVTTTGCFKPIKGLVLSTFILLVLGIAESSYAAPTSLVASKDAYIRSGTYGDKNYGTNPLLLVKYAAGHTNSVNTHRKIYTQFDLSSVAPATIADANLATLSLTVGDAMIGSVDPTAVYTFHVYGLTDGASEDFDEGTGTTTSPASSGITYNNAPFNDAAPNVITGGVDVGTFSLIGRGTAGDVVSLTSASLLNFVQSSTNSIVDFAIVRDSPEVYAYNVVHTFASKEHGGGYAGPTLTLDHTSAVTTIPEAGSLALVAPVLGLLGFALTVRKSHPYHRS